MTTQIDTTAVINGVRFSQQGSHPSAPDAGYSILYNYTGTNPGMYLQDAAGEIVGPFITGSASSQNLISSETLGSDGSFANVTIPTGYDEIRVVCRIRTADAGVADRIGLRVGTGGSLDTGSNYSYDVQWTGASAGGSQSVTATYISSSIVTGDGAAAGYFGYAEFRIISPNDTGQWSNVSVVGGNTDPTIYRTGTGVGTWRNAAVIDIVNILGVATATFKAGSRMDVIGIRFSNP